MYKSGQDALQGANSVEQLKSVKRQNNERKSYLTATVTLTRTRSMELLAQCTKFEQKIKAMISKVPDGQTSRPSWVGGRSNQRQRSTR